jgi:hypothetical protein
LQRIKDEEARERERQRILDLIKKEQQIQEKLKQIAKCPAGFQWIKQGGGYRCGGGSHYVSQAELDFTLPFNTLRKMSLLVNLSL